MMAHLCINETHYRLSAWYRKKWSVFCLIATLFSLSLSVETAFCDVVFDDFSSSLGWVGPNYSYGFTDSGDAWIDSGVLTVRHAPKYKWHTVSMKKDFYLDFQPDMWIHMRFKLNEKLLGADMYTTIKLDDQMILEMGINGEQLWYQNQVCVQKTWDDELFIGSSVIVGESSGKRTDMRVALSSTLAGQVSYDQWVLFSMKFEAAGQTRRIRFFVNGVEILYNDIDFYPPTGAIDNRLLDSYKPSYGNNKLSIELANFTDGDSYGDTSVNNGWGVRWLHAFADMTPAVPHSTTPALAVKKNSDMMWDCIIVHPGNRSGEDLDLLKPFVSDMIFGGRITVPQAVYMDLIRWQDAEVNAPWMSQDEIQSVRDLWLGSSYYALPPTGSFSIAFGANQTSTRSVVLSIYAEDDGIGMGEMRFSNDQVTWSAWEDYTVTKSWELTDGAGTKTVHGQFRDKANLESSVCNDTIEYIP